jgi:hypothetical protein
LRLQVRRCEIGTENLPFGEIVPRTAGTVHNIVRIEAGQNYALRIDVGQRKVVPNFVNGQTRIRRRAQNHKVAGSTRRAIPCAIRGIDFDGIDDVNIDAAPDRRDGRLESGLFVAIESRN